jgi:hypothetical protein
MRAGVNGDSSTKKMIKREQENAIKSSFYNKAQLKI